MQAIEQTAPAPTMAPISRGERIEALDVVRGFALIGIFLMNVEFFSRPMNGIGEGMPVGLTGLDWFASFFVAYFVQGKFWTIFSLLFGMGFAVMLTRAEAAGRNFIGTYLRRILALAVIGAVHYIFIWQGDILFSYAVAAGMLMILLYGKWKPIFIGMAVCLGLGFVPGFDSFFGIVFGLVFVSLCILYLRGEKMVNIRGSRIPLISVILLSVGTLVTIAAIVFWLLPNGPKDPRVPLSVMGPILLLIGYLAAKYREPVEKRTVRLAITLYIFAGATMTIFGLVDYLTPPEPEVPMVSVATPAVPAVAGKDAGAKVGDDKVAVASAIVAAPLASKAVVADAAKTETVPVAAAARSGDIKDARKDGKKDEKKVEKTPAEKAAEKKADRAKRLANRAKETNEEIRIMSKGTYLETVEFRARKFLEKAAGDAGFATILIGMFLLGNWFVRSGVMQNTAAHLAFFRKLATIALPIGIGMGLLGSLIAVRHIPGVQHDGYQLAHGLTMLGNLPACVGYVGLVVLMLHSNTLFSKIRILAPAGRMALTNYLTQTIIGTLYFYGFGLGQWGMSRAWQIVFVAVVFAIQIAFSHWWLARFRYGPMEWLWRGFTYRQIPAFRLATPSVAAPAAMA